MKKLLALLLAMFMMLSLVACGGAANGDNEPSSKPVVGSDDTSGDVGDEKDALVLENKEAYVVVVKNGSTLTINSIRDIKGLTVGVAYEGDGEKIAEYYEANVVGYGGENDAFSDLIGSSKLDCLVVKKLTAEDYQKSGRAKIILDPIVIE